MFSALGRLTGKAQSGEAATSAIGLESGLVRSFSPLSNLERITNTRCAIFAQVKSGYLTKRAKISQTSWKKRYFVLNAHSLTYYKDIKQVGAAQGDLLLTGTIEYFSTVHVFLNTLYCDADRGHHVSSRARGEPRTLLRCNFFFRTNFVYI